VELLTKIYWLRVALGAIAGLISAGALLLWQTVTPSASMLALIGSLNTLLNGITIALLIYLVSYYILKSKYASKIEKQSKIMTMGIFIYFFTWIIVWVLTISLVLGQL
jgi:hypothetical protein